MKIPYNHAIYIRVLHLLYSCDKIMSLDQNTYFVFKWYNIDATVTAIRSVDIYARYVWISLNTCTISWTRDTILNSTIYLAITKKERSEKKGRGRRRRKSLLILHALVPFHDFHAISNREVCHYRATILLARSYANREIKLRRKQLKSQYWLVWDIPITINIA